MKVQTILSILFLLPITLSYYLEKKLPCVETGKCICFKHTDKYEYQCPPPTLNSTSITLFVNPESKIVIQCTSDSAKILDMDIFPDIDVGNVEKFQVSYCPLANYKNFKEILEYFKGNQTESFIFENSAAVNAPITKEYFAGLSMLKKLNFNTNTFIFSQDFLDDLPSLTELILYHNDIKKIDFNLNLANLTFLDLSRNVIKEIPQGLFKKLPSLQVLHLWKNDLTILDKTSFEGGTKIRSLELSNNQLESIAEDTFSVMPQLVNISLARNQIKFLSVNTFKNNLFLENVNLRLNPLGHIPEQIFSSIVSLKSIDLSECSLRSLPPLLFQKSSSLKSIVLSKNMIEELPDNVFNGLTNLKHLSLQLNSIKSLPKNFSNSLKKLETLNLENNSLTELNRSSFQALGSLKKLNLRHNLISYIDMGTFSGTTFLEELDLSFNKYDLDNSTYSLDVFNDCLNLQSLDLSNNFITEVITNLFAVDLHLKYLNLSHNNINFLQLSLLSAVSGSDIILDLSHNQISVVDFRNVFEILPSYGNLDAMSNNDPPKIKINIANNSISCNCYNFDLLKYFKGLYPEVKTVFAIEPEDLIQCGENLNFNQLELSDLTCPVEMLYKNYEGSPANCSCDYRPFDTTFVVDCSGRNLTKMPEFSLPQFLLFNQTEVHLENNFISSGPSKDLVEYFNVTRLFLQNNQIKEISWIPPKIKVLQLQGNKLQSLNDSMIAILNKTTTLQKLSLSGNPWRCNCKTVKLQNYLTNHYLIVDHKDIKCNDSHEPLMTKKDICTSYKALYLGLSTTFAVIGLAVALTFALYYRYQQEIKVWLYAKNLFLWFVTEEEVDKDKVYDVFISYSHKDEEFVTENILPVLESGPKPYKVCVHYRNFVPGEFIAKQITTSVLESRRTLVVLSNSFLDSVWGKLEFRTAHTHALSEGRARVIVVILGDLNEDSLGDELKTYLKTKTYIKWGDPYFWNKLKYALPHNNLKNTNDQKLANIMLKIDDKFELVHQNPVNPGSTPPVTLDVSMLKKYPLDFTPSVNSHSTPPAEAGLGPLLVRTTK